MYGDVFLGDDDHFLAVVVPMGAEPEQHLHHGTERAEPFKPRPGVAVPDRGVFARGVVGTASEAEIVIAVGHAATPKATRQSATARLRMRPGPARHALACPVLFAFARGDSIACEMIAPVAVGPFSEISFGR
jgi:hypothetical protein